MEFNFDNMNNSNEEPNLNPDEIIEEEDQPVSSEDEPNIFQIKEKIKNDEELSGEEEKVLMEEFEIVMAIVKKQEEIKRKQKENENLGKEEEVGGLNEEERRIDNEGEEIILLVAEATDKGLISVGREMNKAIDDMDEIKKFKELSDEEKMERIEERKEKIEGAAEEMGIELKDDIGEIEKQIKDFRKELKEKYEEYAEMEEKLNQIHGANTEEEKGLDKMKETLSYLKEIYKGQLHIEYLEYWKKYKKDPESLLESHAERNLLMNNWEALIGNLEAAERGEEEVLKGWVQWVKRNPEITLAALALAIAATAAVGVLLYPEVMALLAEEGGKKIIEEAGPEAVKAAAETSLWVAGKALVGAGAGAVVGAGILGKGIAWISDEENRDKLAEWLCGAKIPGIAYWPNGRPGAKKTG